MAVLSFTAVATTAGDDAPLPELFVDGFDTEQIWEEIKIQVRPKINLRPSPSQFLFSDGHNVA